MIPLAASSVSTPSLGGPALRAFFAVAQAWHLTDTQQQAVLGHPRAALWATWKAEASAQVSSAALERISHVLAIYRALHTLFPNPAQADTWVQRANQAAGWDGRTAAHLMSSGQLADLVSVRRYLDAQVSG